jgi:hypothetical protein
MLTLVRFATNITANALFFAAGEDRYAKQNAAQSKHGIKLWEVRDE